MTRANEVKDRFRARLQEADARSNDFRKKLLEDGTRALEPVVGVLNLSLIHLSRSRRDSLCRSRWSAYP